MRKIPTRLCGMNFCTSSVRFAPSFVRQPNGPECTQMIRNTPKRQFRVQLSGLGAFVAKNSDTISWHDVLHLCGPFSTEFCKATKRSRMHPMVQNAPKHQFRVQWSGSGVFVGKNSDAISRHEFCTSSARFPPSFVRQPNSPGCTQMVQNAPKCQFRDK